MNTGKSYTGSCSCGAIRYRVYGPPVMVEYCHCDDCRKSSGSAVSALAGFRRGGFEILDGLPTYHNATPEVKRSFCGTCGSPLFYENQEYPEDIYINLGSFDELEELPPDRHVWVSERISWYQIRDNLSQFSQFSGTGSSETATPHKKPGIKE